MKSRILLPAFFFAIALVASSSNASAFELLDRLIGRGGYSGGGCNSCCEPSCCEPVCCEAEPVCCEAEPTCCEPAPSCCEPSCGHHCRPFKKFCGWLKGCCHHRSHCGPSCCEPSCGEPVCCESACESSCGCN